MKKRVLAMFLTAMAVSGLTMVCGAESGDEQLSVKFIMEGTNEEKVNAVIEAYEEQTGVDIVPEYYPFSDLVEVVETKAGSNNMDADVMYVDVTFVAKYASSGYLAPLDSYFTDEEKAEWNDASYTSGVWDGIMYAASPNTSSQMLYYNKNLLDEAGIEVPENDAEHRLTYEQVADLAKQALEKLDPDGSRGLIGFDFQQVSTLYQMNQLPNSMGGANISEDGYSLDGVINTEPWIKAMTWYQNLVNDGIASRGYNSTTLPEMIYSGKVIFAMGVPGLEKRMTCDDELDYTYSPCFEGYEDQVATPTGSWYLAVNAQSEKKDAAVDFIKFFTLGEGNDIWIDIKGDIPSRPAKVEEMLAEGNKSMEIASYEAANTAYPRAITPMMGEYATVINQAWEDVRNGADVEETLNAAVEQFASAVAANQ